MEKIYIFGASKLGELALQFFRDSYEIVGFIDNNPHKQESLFCGIHVFSPIILQSTDLEVIIASSYSNEIENQLIDMDYLNYQIFSLAVSRPNLQSSRLIKNNINSISAGALINSVDMELTIEDMTFLNGGSTAMDYFFLKAVALKRNAETYLEIGTWTGESISGLAENVKNCYSISLPDDDPDLTRVFDKYCNKHNFSRYFSYRHNNIVHYQENSMNFDFSKIKQSIDMVFIDGDHSYQGIKQDSTNIFSKCGYENTIVIWHDFKTFRNELVLTTYKAIKECIPETYLKNLFAVQGTQCGIYIPSKFIHQFQVGEEKDMIFSYKISINSKVNTL